MVWHIFPMPFFYVAGLAYGVIRVPGLITDPIAIWYAFEPVDMQHVIDGLSMMSSKLWVKCLVPAQLLYFLTSSVAGSKCCSGIVKAIDIFIYSG